MHPRFLRSYISWVRQRLARIASLLEAEIVFWDGRATIAERLLRMLDVHVGFPARSVVPLPDTPLEFLFVTTFRPAVVTVRAEDLENEDDFSLPQALSRSF